MPKGIYFRNLDTIKKCRVNGLKGALKRWSGHVPVIRDYHHLSLPYMHKARFGGTREEVIKRDHEKCCDCGMTRAEHKSLFGCDITVNHVDHNGRYSKYKNNNLDNLETLCLRCHGRKDVAVRYAGLGA